MEEEKVDRLDPEFVEAALEAAPRGRSVIAVEGVQEPSGAPVAWSGCTRPQLAPEPRACFHRAPSRCLDGAEQPPGGRYADSELGGENDGPTARSMNAPTSRSAAPRQYVLATSK